MDVPIDSKIGVDALSVGGSSAEHGSIGKINFIDFGISAVFIVVACSCCSDAVIGYKQSLGCGLKILGIIPSKEGD